MIPFVNRDLTPFVGDVEGDDKKEKKGVSKSKSSSPDKDKKEKEKSKVSSRELRRIKRCASPLLDAIMLM